MRTLLILLVCGLAGWGQNRTPEPADLNAQLAGVRRIYVDLLTGGDPALIIRDLLMSSLQASKLIVITENQDKADAVLKGAADESVFTDLFSSSEGLSAHSQIGLPSTGSNGRASRTSAGVTLSEHESQTSKERKHEAIATVRLVDRNGDVIWSTTQESVGGKFRGASADVADKVATRLAADINRARQQPGGPPRP